MTRYLLILLTALLSAIHSCRDHTPEPLPFISVLPDTLSVMSDTILNQAIEVIIQDNSAEVELSVTGLPSGAMAHFTPVSASGSFQSMLMIDPGTASAGMYSITLEAESGEHKASRSVILKITFNNICPEDMEGTWSGSSSCSPIPVTSAVSLASPASINIENFAGNPLYNIVADIDCQTGFLSFPSHFFAAGPVIIQVQGEGWFDLGTGLMVINYEQEVFGTGGSISCIQNYSLNP